MKLTKVTCTPQWLFLADVTLHPRVFRGPRDIEGHAAPPLLCHQQPPSSRDEAFSSCSLLLGSSRPRAPLLAMQLIRPTVWGPGLVTSLKGAGSTQPLSSFWSQQNFEQFLAATKFLSLLWPVGLCCWLQPPHVTSSPAVAVKFLSPRLLFVDFIPLLYYFPLSSPLLGTRFLQQQQLQKAVEKRSFFWLSRAFFGRGEMCAPRPPALVW